MITELTPEQEALLPVYREKWIKNALDCTEMTAEDREHCTKAAHEMYKLATMKSPVQVLFVKSPLILRFASGFLAAAWWMLRNPLAAELKCKLKMPQLIEASVEAALKRCEGQPNLPPRFCQDVREVVLPAVREIFTLDPVAAKALEAKGDKGDAVPEEEGEKKGKKSKSKK